MSDSDSKWMMKSRVTGSHIMVARMSFPRFSRGREVVVFQGLQSFGISDYGRGKYGAIDLRLLGGS